MIFKVLTAPDESTQNTTPSTNGTVALIGFDKTISAISGTATGALIPYLGTMADEKVKVESTNQSDGIAHTFTVTKIGNGTDPLRCM